MKVISLTVLLYGKTYLGWALKSVLPYVDECWVLYSAIGSHGFRTSVPCPETRDELYAIAKAVAGDKLRWYESEWQTEVQQRDAIYELVPDADVIVVVDSDEIWPDLPLLSDIISEIELGYFPEIRSIRVPMIHYWRSFYRCVLHDPSYPVRIINAKATSGERLGGRAPGYSQQWNERAFVNHMGYAQPANIVRYKQLTHGHRGQWREGWFDNIFMDENRRNDLHPVGSDAWNWETINPWDCLPSFMKSHPFANLEVIP